MYVRIKTSRYIHIVADEGGASLKCGRMLSDKYMRLDEACLYTSRLQHMLQIMNSPKSKKVRVVGSLVGVLKRFESE